MKKSISLLLTVCIMLSAFAFSISADAAAISAAIAPKTVKFGSTAATLGINEKYKPSVIYTPADATTTRTYSSNNSAVASVDSAGVITAKKAGSATITVKTYNNIKATIVITVKAAPTSISMNVTAKTIKVGQTLQLSSTVNSGSASRQRIYKSNNEAVATVSAAGLVTAKKAGTAKITVSTYNSRVATATITVIAIAPKTVKFGSTAATLGINEKYKPSVVYTPADATTTRTYSSNNSAVASVDSAGVITAKKAGSATITVKTYNNIKATIVITVKAAPTSISMNVTAKTIKVGQTLQLTNTVNSGSASRQRIYKSNNEAVATVSAAGLVTAKKAGTAKITVSTYNSRVATATITVVNDTSAFPVGGSIADIVTSYNKYANAVKKYTGKIVVSKKQGTTTTLDFISPTTLKSTVESAMPDDWATAPTDTYTFTNGKTANGEMTLNNALPPSGEAYVSKLSAAGVASATCVKDGANYKYTIKLKPETGNSISYKPVYHSSCMDTLSLTANDLEPFTLKNYKITYTGATIAATVDAKGRLISLGISLPVKLTASASYGSFMVLDIGVTAVWRQSITCKY